MSCTSHKDPKKSFSAEQVFQEPVLRKKRDQGQHECEVFNARAENINKEGATAWRECDKNPGHSNFIPAGRFSLKHLPQWCRDQSLVNLVHGLVKLTVRVSVHYTSLRRPDGYTFSQFRGSKLPHVGSGYVSSIQEVVGPCRCQECQASSNPLQHSYHILISTACHVVYDSTEARATRVDLFHDVTDGPGDSSNLNRPRSLHGMDVVARLEAYGDWCMVRCATHDADLAKLLQDQVDFAGRTLPDNRWLGGGVPNVCVVVSHPHGMSKQVSVGKVVDRSPPSSWSTVFEYSSPTCAGSSGGPVFVAFPSSDGYRKWLGPHSGFVRAPPFPISQSGSCVNMSESKLPGLNLK